MKYICMVVHLLSCFVVSFNPYLIPSKHTPKKKRKKEKNERRRALGLSHDTSIDSEFALVPTSTRSFSLSHILFFTLHSS